MGAFGGIFFPTVVVSEIPSDDPTSLNDPMEENTKGAFRRDVAAHTRVFLTAVKEEELGLQNENTLVLEIL